MEAGHAGACPAVHSWSVMKYREDLHTPNPRLRNANNVGSELPQLCRLDRVQTSQGGTCATHLPAAKETQRNEQSVADEERRTWMSDSPL